MNSEKGQLIAVGSIIAIIVLCVVIFFVVGGEFLWFSAEGIFAEYLWGVPLIFLLVQQLYAIPQYLKGFYKLFSSSPPTAVDLYVPIINEHSIFSSVVVTKIMLFCWIIIVGFILINALPFIGIEVISNVIGGVGGTGAVATFSFYTILISIFLLIIISFLRGSQYMSVRKDIYDLHNKYLGVRGKGFVAAFCVVLYFIPVARCIAILMDIQIIHKLTKLNDVTNMKVELRED